MYKFRDGILGHNCTVVYQRFKSLAPCYSQSLLLADFEIFFKKSAKHFVERKNDGRKSDKNSSLRNLYLKFRSRLQSQLVSVFALTCQQT
jgi:hypothetical protein